MDSVISMDLCYISVVVHWFLVSAVYCCEFSFVFTIAIFRCIHISIDAYHIVVVVVVIRCLYYYSFVLMHLCDFLCVFHFNSCWWWIWRKFCSPRELRSRTIHIGRPCEEKYPPNEIRNQVSFSCKLQPLCYALYLDAYIHISIMEAIAWHFHNGQYFSNLFPFLFFFFLFSSANRNTI